MQPAPTQPALPQREPTAAGSASVLERPQLSRDVLDQLVRSIPSILVLVDAAGRIELWNRAAERVFGVREIDALGRRLVEVLPGIASELQSLLARSLAIAGVVDSGDLRYESGAGERALVGLSVTHVAGGAHSGFLILGREITQKKKLDAQLAHSLKLESIGQLAAGIAHEINTPTQFVNDNLRFLGDTFAELEPLLCACTKLAAQAAGANADDVAHAARAIELDYLAAEIPKAIDESLSGLHRVTRIVAALKEFSHPSTGEKVALDLNRAIDSTLTVARNEWKYVAEVELDLAPDLPQVLCLPDEMNQVVLNVVVNAAHAIAQKHADAPQRKGRIAISTRCDGHWVELRIRDDGTGIPDGIRERIFDPFFTTKPVGKGTGQGLAIARSVVVDKHRGTIHVESVAGQGATFVIRLPLHSPDEARADSSP
jgi:PAS domain S-box-containing protein